MTMTADEAERLKGAEAALETAALALMVLRMNEGLTGEQMDRAVAEAATLSERAVNSQQAQRVVEDAHDEFRERIERVWAARAEPSPRPH